jgi:Xaa-Pro aminopeptidase
VSVDIGTLPAMDVSDRLPRLHARIANEGVEALAVTRLPNVAYLTGFTGSAGVVVVTPERDVLITDGRYSEQAREQLDAAGVDAEIKIAITQSAQTAALVQAIQGIGRLGLEAHGVAWAQQRMYADAVGDIELVPTEHVVEKMREVKEPGEVARIRAACAIADEALAEVLPSLHEAPTEQEFARALEWAMRARGATRTSFETIVASGPNGAKPHARPTDRAVGAGELVVIDFGCVVDGYCSDMTRTVSVGDPGSDARRVWDVVLESQRAGRDAVRAGVKCAAVDRASRAVIEDAGWGETFAHGTGHGVGLEIHESPRVAATADGTLEPGHVVTVEPGVYLPGVGGVRIEDTVVVTPDGADALTAFPKSLVI